jgi:hypothetical protein
MWNVTASELVKMAQADPAGVQVAILHALERSYARNAGTPRLRRLAQGLKELFESVPANSEIGSESASSGSGDRVEALEDEVGTLYERLEAPCDATTRAATRARIDALESELTAILDARYRQRRLIDPERARKLFDAADELLAKHGYAPSDDSPPR